MIPLTIRALSTSSGENPDADRKDLIDKRQVSAEDDSPQPPESPDPPNPPNPVCNGAKSSSLLLSYHLCHSQRPLIVFSGMVNAGQDNFHESKCTLVRMIYPPETTCPPLFSSSSIYWMYLMEKPSKKPHWGFGLVLCFFGRDTFSQGVKGQRLKLFPSFPSSSLSGV
ncbi:hypothetical protein AALP_AA3G289200, partial [Arabis alpina]